mmetsp:Transcript_22680/g.25554  ORF Transcript_22680/g.25554 Transcript_22680/m.25554 type:complete len:276 (+) Transcript_22680:146-973(+)
MEHPLHKPRKFKFEKSRSRRDQKLTRITKEISKDKMTEIRQRGLTDTLIQSQLNSIDQITRHTEKLQVKLKKLQDMQSRLNEILPPSGCNCVDVSDDLKCLNADRVTSLASSNPAKFQDVQLLGGHLVTQRRLGHQVSELMNVNYQLDHIERLNSRHPVVGENLRCVEEGFKSTFFPEEVKQKITIVETTDQEQSDDVQEGGEQIKKDELGDSKEDQIASADSEKGGDSARPEEKIEERNQTKPKLDEAVVSVVEDEKEEGEIEDQDDKEVVKDK